MFGHVNDLSCVVIKLPNSVGFPFYKIRGTAINFFTLDFIFSYYGHIHWTHFFAIICTTLCPDVLSLESGNKNIINIIISLSNIESTIIVITSTSTSQLTAPRWLILRLYGYYSAGSCHWALNNIFGDYAVYVDYCRFFIFKISITDQCVRPKS